MKKLLFSSVLALSSLVFAEHSIELFDGYKLRLGVDERARWEFFDRTVPSPEGHSGPANQYLRLRTRAWMALDMTDALTLNLRMANRVHFVSSSPADPNNQGTSTWKFPDEFYVDALNAVIKPDENLTITIGRQAFSFGNGMIIADPTPFDQGRSAYTDGLLVKYAGEADDISIFVTYDTWKDHNVFLNDQNRPLRSGDIFTAGVYWTHKFSDLLNLDAYYLFNDVNDRHPYSAERNHPADCNDSLHTAGMRAFGKTEELIDYSLEMAGQFGRNPRHKDNCGKMADARLNLHLPYLTESKPVFGLEYTYFSGDKTDSGRNEGWSPLLSQAPLWGEELMAIMLNGNWTNLHLYKASLSAAPLENFKAGISMTECFTDETNGHGGHHLGLLASTNLVYKYNENLSFAFQLSHFSAGNVFDNGHDSIWGRFETVISF